MQHIFSSKDNAVNPATFSFHLAIQQDTETSKRKSMFFYCHNVRLKNEESPNTTLSINTDLAFVSCSTQAIKEDRLKGYWAKEIKIMVYISYYSANKRRGIIYIKCVSAGLNDRGHACFDNVIEVFLQRFTFYFKWSWYLF